MLPSMPILFSKESQDAFGIKIEPSTSFFSQNSAAKPVINPEPQPAQPQKEPQVINEVKANSESEKKKSDPPNNALEDALAKSYFSRIQQRFSSNPYVPTNKSLQFQNILREFDPGKETPVDLYRKIEKLFGAEHKDLMEDFLLFLKPGQATQVGRFMDRFSLVQITGFIDLLHKTFARKPTVLRKVIRALTTALDSGSGGTARTRVLPHFRAHPRLTHMFKALFPDERPSDSWKESAIDTIAEGFLTHDRGADTWEFSDEPDSAITGKSTVDASATLDTMYLNGRVFLQHGRMLRSARVAFPYSKEPYRVHARRLAPAHCHPSPPDSGDESHKKKPLKRPRKQTKSPTKKDVNDNRKDTIISPKPKRPQKPKNNKREEVKADIPKKEKNTKNSIKKEIDVPIKKETEPPKTKQPKLETVTENVKSTDAEPPKLKLKIEVNAISKVTELDSLTKQVKVEAVSVKTEVFKDGPKVKQTRVIPKACEKIPLPTRPAKPKIEATVSVETKNIGNINNWTRDEDKTMLQVLKGEAGSEKVFGKIRELLPHRSETEIKDRFCHVMTLLQQMAVGEVT